MLRKTKITAAFLLLFRLAKMKEWKCVSVGHHNNVGKVIEDWEKVGWRLHQYSCAGNATLRH